ncbi:MAG: hypothetical protein ACLPV8_13810 [Steroidobacteraceae bacterium]
MDYALDHPNSLYFKGWTSEDFDAAQMWVASCFASPPTNEDKDRQSLLAQRRAAMETRGEIQRNDEILKAMHAAELQDQRNKDAQEAARRAEEAKELADSKAAQSARRAEEAKELAVRKAKQAAHDECLQSYSYHRYVAETHILEALDRESNAQRSLDHERRVEEVSGTTNLSAKHNAGESLVAAQDDLNKWWTVYHQYGGDAETPRSVPRSIENPCSP